MCISKIILVGHVDNDLEMRILDGNIAVAGFSLATMECFTKDGAKKEQTEWHNIIMRRGMAEHAVKILKKGKLIYLEGRVKTRLFEDKSGVKRFTTEIVAESFTLLGRSSDF